MKKNFRIFSFLLIFLLLISFNVSAQPEQVLKIGIGTDITTFDMINYQGTNDLKSGSMVFESLIELDPDALDNFIPVLATSWEQKDETTWIINLREGVKFTDGTPFNAAAVKFTLERASTGLKSKADVGMIKVVNIINDYQVEIKLHYAASNFMPGLSMQTAGMISPTAVEKYGEDWNKNPVGTARFKLEEWKPGIHIAYTRNEDYWGTPAKLDKVIFYPIPNEATRIMTFRAGEIDVCEDLPAHEVPSIEADPNSRIQIQPNLRTIFLALDTLNDTLKDKKIRQAIALGIDKESIHKYTMEELAPEAKYGFLPPYLQKRSELIGYPYDPKRAKELLAEAGYADGLVIDLWVPEGRYAKGEEIAQVVQGQLKEIGIDVKISIMQSAAFWGETIIPDIEKPFQMLLIGWLINPDPVATYIELFQSGSITNFFNYNMDEKILSASTAVGADARNAVYLSMDREVIEEAAMIPIYYASMIFAINEKVQDFASHPMDYLRLEDTYIK
ncbi:MAG: hypothetical protein IMZ63_00970 [Actinobacteria bacterium]|nr:hypothetical protein [Actinomycetota bacterium]